MFANIFASALALAAVVLAALAWIISLRLKLESELSRTSMHNSLKTLSAKLVTLQDNVAKLRSTSPVGLSAEVAELSGAVARLAKTQQRFAGKFYATNDMDQRRNGIDAPNSGDLDPELAAELALQSAAPVAPGRA